MVATLTCETRADDDVRVLTRGRLYERLNLARIVLAVRVELTRILVAHAPRVLEAGAHRATDPQVERQVKDGHARGARDIGGRVRRPVGDHEDVREGRLFSLHHLEDITEHLLLVPRRDNDEQA